ncbi:MAG: o-succinylbenzoate synthase [Microlunatus sp.]|nr:o-succinylbenzoate synthase [Microlunatus sp.]MDN5771100.1 o-succinylbenzoate synthase [Microlunatus sp.]MDN5804327.1 o-succinylbenzoate synthase [Microlunatus sp.]
MMITSVRLHRLSMPLVSPFTTSFGTEHTREALLVEIGAETDRGEVTGWGECVAMEEPLYSPEYVDGSIEVTRRWLIPAVIAAEDLVAERVGHHLRHVVGHPMAKAAVEMAVLDAQLRAAGQSFGDYLGGVRRTVPSGVSVGIQDSIEQTLQVVEGYLDEGYARIKLKIAPGWDVEPVRAVRHEFGDDVLLQVDANAAYTLLDSPTLRRLDDFDLLLIEQPLAENDLRQHAILAGRLQTPICLDESVVSVVSAADAISLGAAEVINVKPGRVGGYLEAVRIHDLARAHGIAVWCGGMVETGLGRSANAALASLPGFVLPGDISASSRFYAEDITEPVEMVAGEVAVDTTPGVGRAPLPDLLEKYRVSRHDVYRR